jgi:hypothetical protein
MMVARHECLENPYKVSPSWKDGMIPYPTELTTEAMQELASEVRL